MIIICGKTIAEVERDLEMAKRAIASGMPYGVGGATIEEAEKGLAMLSTVADNAPIDNPNYVPPHSCGCSCDYCTCNVCGGCEDEDTCPACGADHYAGWDGESCPECGYGYDDDEEEEEPPIVTALADMLRSLGMDETTIGELMRSALGM